MDRIDLVDFRLGCILGVLDSEQRAAQPLQGEISLWLNLDTAGETGRLDATVNYADVAGWVSFLTTHGRFRLLESISVAALRLLLLPPSASEARAQVQRARIQLRKPTILGELATPGTEMIRDAAWAPVTALSEGPKVLRETLVDTGRSAAWRLQLPADTSWTVPANVAVYVIAGRVEPENDLNFGPNTALPMGRVSSLRAAGDGPATLLAVQVPPPPE